MPTFYDFTVYSWCCGNATVAQRWEDDIPINAHRVLLNQQNTGVAPLYMLYMENYLLCGELGSTVGNPPSSRVSEPTSNSGSSSEVSNGGCLLYKGRRKGSVEFVGIWKHSKAKKDLIANGVSLQDVISYMYIIGYLSSMRLRINIIF